MDEPFGALDALTVLTVVGLRSSAVGAAPLSGLDLRTAALAHAIARGEHLVKTRVGCDGCHGADFQLNSYEASGGGGMQGGMAMPPPAPERA